MTYFLIR